MEKPSRDDSGGWAELEYQSGFGNHFSSEALPGALPTGQNNPLLCPYGLYAEQISGTAFTAPRKQNQRSWLYRIKPSVTHEPFHPRIPGHKHLVSEFNQLTSSVTPTQLRWKPADVPDAPTDFIDGLYTICGAGSSFLRHGYAIHMYAANKSMDGCAFCNADGDFLIVPQKGRLLITTECGKLQVSPGEMVVLPQGFRFAIDLPDGPSRGYVAEVFGTHFQLPELGPIGANGLASPRDFLAPTAWFEESFLPGYTIVQKFGGELFTAKQDFSPFNVVAWHGNYVPYKAKADGFLPGGASLHSCMTPHGPDTKTYEATIARGEDAEPLRISGTVAFMFESSLIPRVCPWALESPNVDADYYRCWIGLRSHFSCNGRQAVNSSLTANSGEVLLGDKCGA
ncbi:homogentisate 1,2-dioxygenase isoform X2 [Elaeis guineensis]|uniref:homogentisate 1,2-dioxygenase n=1 Tax=Elaeis guineensis var. tenera TaxID=51953 RepID=A0A6I9QW14_ELAGV|nr:homogentisate 1,2-dioxygenase isoform X2 [Elaeis guineensis]